MKDTTMKNTTYAVLFSLTPFTATAGGLSEAITQPVITPIMETEARSADIWQGFYLGGQLGAGNLSTTMGPDDVELDATNFGAHIGYMRDLGKIIVGGELEISRVEFDDILADSDTSLTSLKARLGYDAGNVLPYFTVGSSNLTIKSNNSGNLSGTDGLLLGLGAAYAMNDSIILGAEYARNRFEEDGDTIDINQLSLRASYKF
jgi:opacity protein-like surface antigen